MRQCHDHICWRDQVFSAQVKRAVFNQAAAGAKLGLAELLTNGCQFFTDDDGHTFWTRQNVEQIINLNHDLFVLGHNFVLLQSCQALQSHLQNFLGLRV